MKHCIKQSKVIQRRRKKTGEAEIEQRIEGFKNAIYTHRAKREDAIKVSEGNRIYHPKICVFGIRIILGWLFFKK